MLEFLLMSAISLQIIQVNSTAPCFLNYTAGPEIWRNCGITEDYLETALMPWEYATGGNFSMLLASLFILMTYIKYQKVVYPILIGIVFLPISYFLFPDSFIVFAVLMAFIGVGILIWYAFIKQTKEY